MRELINIWIIESVKFLNDWGNTLTELNEKFKVDKENIYEWEILSN